MEREARIGRAHGCCRRRPAGARPYPSVRPKAFERLGEFTGWEEIGRRGYGRPSAVTAS